jgi:uncharacterized protein
MLLFIALANAPGLAPGTPVDVAQFSGIEQVATFFMSTFVHARAYPVFAIMFGYGLVQLALRQQAAGATKAGVRAVLLRRNAWLIVFGFFHAALLYFADFLGAYGLIGITATLLLLNSERAQRVLLWFWALPVIEMLVLAVLIGIGLSNGAGPVADVQVAPVASAVAPSYIDSIFARLSEWSMHTATVLPAIFVVNLGMWAARRRMLEDLESHARLLRWVACGSLAIAFIGGLPHTFVTLGMLHADEQTAMFINILHKVSGMFGGPGYIALIGLIALRLSRSNRGAMRTGISGAMVALGQRSLSGYLLQSIAWLLLFSPYALGMGYRFDSAFITSLVLALIVWIATLFGAALCQRYSYRGPAEVLLRRLAYGSQYRSTPGELKIAETV